MAHSNINASTSVIYGDAKHVDSKFSAIFEPNLFADNVLRPGISYTDKYSIGPAGQIFVHKTGLAGVTVGSPSGNFSHENVEDSLINIVLDKAFRQSRMIYGDASATTAGNLESNELATAIQEIAQAWQLEGLKTLVVNSDLASNTAEFDNTNATNSFKKNFIDMRKALRNNKAQPDIALLSTEAYAYALDYSGREYQLNTNDEILRTGMIGVFMGINTAETQLFLDDVITYEIGARTEAAVAAVVAGDYVEVAVVTDGADGQWDTIYGGTYTAVVGDRFIVDTTDADLTGAGTVRVLSDANNRADIAMYDHDAFSIVTALDMMRVIPAIDFNGRYAQVEMLSGFKVTNTDRVLVKYTVVA